MAYFFTGVLQELLSVRKKSYYQLGSCIDSCSSSISWIDNLKIFILSSCFYIKFLKKTKQLRIFRKKTKDYWIWAKNLWFTDRWIQRPLWTPLPFLNIKNKPEERSDWISKSGRKTRNQCPRNKMDFFIEKRMNLSEMNNKHSSEGGIIPPLFLNHPSFCLSPHPPR